MAAHVSKGVVEHFRCSPAYQGQTQFHCVPPSTESEGEEEHPKKGRTAESKSVLAEEISKRKRGHPDGPGSEEDEGEEADTQPEERKKGRKEVGAGNKEEEERGYVLFLLVLFWLNELESAS